MRERGAAGLGLAAVAWGGGIMLRGARRMDYDSTGEWIAVLEAGSSMGKRGF